MQKNTAMQLADEPNPATYNGEVREPGPHAAAMREFRLSQFQSREAYERALNRAGEIMAELRASRPSGTVHYWLYWHDAAAVQSTTIAFFNRAAFALAAAARERCSADQRILKVTIVAVAARPKKPPVVRRLTSAARR
jgi:hypothetical protein